MAGTFSSFSSSTYALSTNPTTVTSSGTIDVDSTLASVAGIYGTSGIAWTLISLGTVESVGNQGTAIYLKSGGLVTNGTPGGAALIEGSQTGISINGSPGTVSNFGTISSTETSGGHALFLLAGGTVTNGASGATAALITAATNAILIA